MAVGVVIVMILVIVGMMLVVLPNLPMLAISVDTRSSKPLPWPLTERAR